MSLAHLSEHPVFRRRQQHRLMEQARLLREEVAAKRTGLVRSAAVLAEALIELDLVDQGKLLHDTMDEIAALCLEFETSAAAVANGRMDPRVWSANFTPRCAALQNRIKEMLGSIARASAADRRMPADRGGGGPPQRNP